MNIWLLSASATIALGLGAAAMAAMDQTGDTACVAIPDVYQSNGIIMIVDKVRMPSRSSWSAAASSERND
jgi:hypothetical protein